MTETRKATAVTDSSAGKKTDPTDASTKLSAEANDKTVAQKPAEVSDKVKEAAENKAKESFGHHNAARTAYTEMDGYLTAKTPLTDKVTVTGADGKAREITVGDRLKELKHTINKEANGAVFEASKIDQKVVSTLLTNTLIERNTLAKDLGLNSNKLSVESISRAIAQTGDATRLAKLQELSQSQIQVDHYKTLENLPAYTKLVYAQYKGSGYTNENTPVERDAKGQLKVDQRDVLDAMSLLSEAGANNPDLRNHDLYLQAVNKVFPRIENSSEKIKTITTEMENAMKFGKEGNIAEQERSLKAAIAQADKVNVPVLAQLVKDPNFQGRQTDAVLSEMANSVVMATTARLQYAQFLAERGRFGEAQVQTLRVKAECPDVMYNLTPDGKLQIGPDGKPLYNNSRFVQLDKLDQQVTQSSTFDPNKLNADMQKFNNQIRSLQGEETDGNKETATSPADKAKHNAQVQANLRNLSSSMNGQITTQKQQLNADKVALDAEKLRLTNDLKALPTKDVITEDARKIEQARIERQIAIIDLQEKELEGQIKVNTQNGQLVKLLEASYDLARIDRSAANAKLAEIEKGDPEFLKAHKETIDAMKKAAEEPGWWDRWGKKALVVLAVAGGVAAGIWLGPGCIASGAAAGTAAAGALGLGVVGTGALATAGAVTYGLALTGAVATAGGLTVGGVGEVARRTGGADINTSFKNNFKDGFMASGEGCLWTVIPGAPGAASKAVLNSARLTEAIATASTATKIAGKVTSAVTFGVVTKAGQDGIAMVTDQTTPEMRAQMPATSGGEKVWNYSKDVAVNSALSFLGALTSWKPIAGVFEGAGMSAARVPYAVNAVFTQSVIQGIGSYRDFNEVKLQGADWQGYKNSSAVFAPWGPQADDPGNTLLQATRVNLGWNNITGGTVSDYVNEVNRRPQANTVVSTKSSFDDAYRIAVKREQERQELGK